MDDYEIGICRWFASGGQSFGFLDYNDGMQIYVHYKNILAKGQRDIKFMEIRKGDKCKFKVAEGFRNNGTQAIEVEIISYGDTHD